MMDRRKVAIFAARRDAGATSASRLVPALLLVSSLLLMLALAGCTKSSYVPCCKKASVYDSVEGKLLDPLQCELADGKEYGYCKPDLADFAGGYLNCTPSSSYCSGSIGECAKKYGCRWDGSLCVPQQCSTIADKQECIDSSCPWDDVAGKCGSGSAAKAIPVCVDEAPASCINNRCEAMMCGFSGTASTPPPSSVDWQADKEKAAESMPTSSLEKQPPGNLQGVSCSFEAMNNKLYNRVKQSRGSLWVNAFRFGVGSSFSDYELSRNFFPQSDKFCAPNPSGKVDRYFNYLGMQNACQEISSFYRCATTGMNFTTMGACGQYCDEPGKCSVVFGTAYPCPETKFAYSDPVNCTQQCGGVSDPNKCTNNEADYPFLTDGARYKAKYTADYLVDTWSTTSFHEVCECKEGEKGAGCDFDRWDPDEHKDCCDYYQKKEDQLCSDNDATDGPWVWSASSVSGTPQNELYTYFNHEKRKSAALELDYEYYAEKLKEQYAQGDLDRQLPYECSSSAECFSGRCDFSDYNRYLVKAGGQVKDVGCSVVADDQRSEHLECRGSYPTEPLVIVDEGTGKVETASRLLERSQSLRDAGGDYTDRFIYVVRRDEAGPQKRYPLFNDCQVPSNEVKYCLYGYYSCSLEECGISPYDVLLPADETTGECDAFAEYPYELILREEFMADRYDVDMHSGFGKCEIKDNSKTPYLDFQKLGWCAPCTYSTLAVQEVNWMRGNDPGYLKSYACYEWHGESAYNYSMNGDYLKGGIVTASGAEDYQLRYASVSDVRKGKGGNPYNGNIQRGDYDAGVFSDDVTYTCNDGWNQAGAWWPRENVPSPSAPYLYSKLSNYLSSNVMPVLDVRGSKTYMEPVFDGYWMLGNFHFKTGYDPVDICTRLGGQGATMFVIGGTDLLDADAPGDHVSSDFLIDKDGGATPFSQYLTTTGHLVLTSLDGPGAVLTRAEFLKTQCVVEPLVGINVDVGQDDLGTLIGAGDLTDRVNPDRGFLHKFFYSDPQNFKWRVRNGVPDKYADNVDLLLQEWYPTCGGDGMLQERVEREVGSRMNFSRALLANLSKPTLIWKFHFPDSQSLPNRGCESPDGHYGTFMEYLFNNTGDMVDAGIIGIIYDKWMTEDGKGWGDPSKYGGSGLSNTPATGALDNPIAGGLGGKTTTPFCEVQKNSRKVLGITRATIGQKIYASDTECECIACEDFDYLTGACNRDNPEEQHYCNDGTKCAMPAGETDYGGYRCSYTCVNITNCRLCSSDSTSKSFCYIEPNDESPVAVTKPYSEINDKYWEWVAGLPAKDKCCIEKALPDQPVQTYTYVARSGGIQKNEFLQYPARGELGIDCGRVPDTSVLEYCGIKIPIATKTFACWRV